MGATKRDNKKKTKKYIKKLTNLLQDDNECVEVVEKILTSVKPKFRVGEYVSQGVVVFVQESSKLCVVYDPRKKRHIIFSQKDLCKQKPSTVPVDWLVSYTTSGKICLSISTCTTFMRCKILAKFPRTNEYFLEILGWEGESFCIRPAHMLGDIPAKTKNFCHDQQVCFQDQEKKFFRKGVIVGEIDKQIAIRLPDGQVQAVDPSQIYEPVKRWK